MVEAQLPLLTVHRRVALVPAATPVIVVVAAAALVIVAVPAKTLQAPVPTAGMVAFIAKVLLLPRVT